MTQGKNGRLWLFQGRDMSRVFNNNQLCVLNQFSYEFLSLKRGDSIFSATEHQTGALN